MSFLKKSFVPVIYALLTVIAATDVVLFAYVNVARYSGMVSEAFFRDPSDMRANVPPSGYSAAGEKAPLPSLSESGWAVRYATPQCGYCRSDEAQWSMLKSKLIKKGYRIYEVPPDSVASYFDSAPELANETQISYVEVGWMKRYRFTATPTTLLFDGRGKLIWSHMGIMNKDDQKSALRAWFFN
jgi:hypothetical protein